MLIHGRARRQRPEGFDDFFRRSYGPTVALARVLTGDHRIAEEIAQDVFAAALARWDHIDTPAAWVRAAVANRSASSWQRRYRERRALETWAASTPHEYTLPEPTEEFWAEVRALPQRQAQCLVLHYLEDLSVREIATILGCAEATVRVHLTRGRQSLSARWEMTSD